VVDLTGCSNDFVSRRTSPSQTKEYG